MSSLHIRTFAADDVDFALTQTARAGWVSTKYSFQAYLAHDPDGCFIGEIDGAPAAMITTSCYSRSAWIGNLIVAPLRRRQGVGERMMRHAIACLENRGVRTIHLEADPMGVGIYRRLGFVEIFETPRFQKSPPQASRPHEARPLTAGELNSVLALDARCFGDERPAMLREFINIAHAAFCVSANDRIVGYAMVLPTSNGVRFGPCAAENQPALESLIDAASEAFPGETIVAAVPSVNAPAVEAFKRRGYPRMSQCLHMVRGDMADLPPDDGIAAYGCGATG